MCGVFALICSGMLWYVVLVCVAMWLVCFMFMVGCDMLCYVMCCCVVVCFLFCCV